MTDEWRSPSQLNEWEVWKPVVGYEGYYEVSSIGSVRSVTRTLPHKGTGKAFRRGMVLRQRIAQNGYRVVGLNKDNKKKILRVHRMVAEAHLSPSDNPWVCHADGDQLNNTVENLYWGTPTDNAQDRIKHGRHYNVNKTRCPRGHEYTARNTYYNSKSGRSCKECRKESSRRLRSK